MRSSLVRIAGAGRLCAVVGALLISAGLVLLPWAAGAAPAALAGTTAQHAAGSATSASHHAAGSHGAVVRGPRLWIPDLKTGDGKLNSGSSVTVSQVNDLDFQSVDVSWKGFPPTTTGGVPEDEPYYSGDIANQYYTVVVAECKGTDPTNPGECWGINSGGLQNNLNEGGLIPRAGSNFNTSYAATGTTGTGEVDFEVYTSVQLPQLHCGPSSPCSLVVIPDDGGNPGGLGNPARDCSDHSGDYEFGYEWAEDQNANQFNNASTIAPCSWDDRIVVPLHFGPLQGTCPVPKTYDVTTEGSPMLYQAMSSWQSKLCGGGKNSISILYDSAISETSAIGAFEDGDTDVALTTLPATGKSSRKFTYAPVAISAESVAFWVDNPATGVAYSQLKLDPTLVLKLITQSYDWGRWGCGANFNGGGKCDKDVENDYTTMFDDPEFIKLNPKISTPLSLADGGAEFQYEQPTTLYGLSDLNWTLTSWLAANKPAMAFLHGAHQGPEHVNTAYKDMVLPTFSLTPMDGYEAYQLYYGQSETLQGVASEYQVVNTSTAHYENACSPSEPGCSPNPGENPENPGERDLFAILDQGDASAFNLPVASLENAAGNYVTPTNATMSAAVNHDMVTASNGITQQVNPTAKVKDAYPLTMVVYAMVPTSGVSKKTAQKIAQWLDYVAGPGQTQGRAVGELPPGFLPLTAKLRAQARQAADEVLHQTGDKSGKSSTSPSPSASTTTSATSASSPAASTSSSPSASGSVSPSPSSTTYVRLGDVADPSGTGIARYALPVLLIAGGVLAVAGSLTILLGQDGGAAGLARLRRLRLKRRKK